MEKGSALTAAEGDLALCWGRSGGRGWKERGSAFQPPLLWLEPLRERSASPPCTSRLSPAQAPSPVPSTSASCRTPPPSHRPSAGGSSRRAQPRPPPRPPGKSPRWPGAPRPDLGRWGRGGLRSLQGEAGWRRASRFPGGAGKRARLRLPPPRSQ